MIERALFYAARGLAVFPCEPRGKRPATLHGVKDATTDAERVRRWWSDRPDANIAIAVPTGVRVLDIDPKNGGDESLDKLIETHGALPLTPMQRTGSGGAHYMLGGWPLADLRTKLVAGVELLGPGRYFIAAPSVHPSGREYDWIVGLDTPVAAAPRWLLVLASRRETMAPASTRTPVTTRAYARAALESAILRIENAGDGDRNNTLNREAYGIARFVHSGHISEGLAIAALVDAARAVGLPAREAEKTVASALRARNAG